jgi:activating signal cointegrator complex subunit 3
MWLYSRCAQHLALVAAASGSGGGGLTPEHLGTSILELFHRFAKGVGTVGGRYHSESAEDDTRLQTGLFELLGELGFDLMILCMERRKELAEITLHDYKRVAAALEATRGASAAASSSYAAGAAAPTGPRIGPGVTVSSERALREEKERRKQDRKLAKHSKLIASLQQQQGVGQLTTASALSSVGFSDDYLAMERALGLQSNDPSAHMGYDDELGQAFSGADMLEGGFEYGVERSSRGAAGPGGAGNGLISADEIIAQVGAGFGGMQKRVLPEGTTIVTKYFGAEDHAAEAKPIRDPDAGLKDSVNMVKAGYKEVTVPAAVPASTGFDPDSLVAIADLDPLAQSAFRGIRRLNRLQSELFQAAYNSNENLLVCAPTGAGKTNVAMLTVCHEALQHVNERGRLQKDDFKIIYVAPMKALAQEVVAKFSERLATIGIVVRELTGDMQLTKKEIAETQIIVTTPEKWDVITRKASDSAIVSQVRLLIIDEVHLLADERGAVIESIVARTLRLVETSQSAIRIVGLSATLPNYQDVASFLRVDPRRGLFYFNDSYRPVPLQQTFIGVSENNALKRLNYMHKLTYDKAMAAIKRGKQVMVFVHSRKDTSKTARALRDIARTEGTMGLLSPFSEEGAEDTDAAGAASEGSSAAAPTNKGAGISSFYSSQDDTAPSAGKGASKTGSTIQGEGRLSLSASQWVQMQREAEKSRNAEMRELYRDGFGIHHAGMLRSDRGLSERMFAAGVTKILVCTATLAWGVNLPAHTVIIKGTQIYNAQSGGFTDLGMLDVMQIFGRAGRPQFDTSGEGIIITSYDKLHHYVRMLTHTLPIESSFIKSLPDHLNAEIASGTVSNVKEAISWLSYTYLYVRMLKNPTAYGIAFNERENDPFLDKKRLDLIHNAGKRLDQCRMIRYDETTGNMAVTDLGRVASYYYINNGSIETFNQTADVDPRALLSAGNTSGAPALTDSDILDLIARADEFKNLKVRDEELAELDMLRAEAHIKVRGDFVHTQAKVNVLLQAYISNAPVRGFTLISDTAYITQSAGRIARALFEIFLKRGYSHLASRLLEICKSIDKRIWWDSSPLWQVRDWLLPSDIIRKLEDSGTPLGDLCDMEAADLGALVRHPNMGPKIHSVLRLMPYVDIEASVQPITRQILRVTLCLYPAFDWSDKLSGGSEPFWLWVEDNEQQRINHTEYVMLSKKQVLSGEPVVLNFPIPVHEPIPPQYWVRIVSDRWIGLQNLIPVSFKHLILPERHPPHTELLDLTPLPVTALKNPGYESFYTRFSHFNPVQTQIFHLLYHTDKNALIGAPTGSGKTVAAELSVFRLLNAHPGAKAVYIAPLKALVSERIKDWQRKFGTLLGKTCVELTGDVTPDFQALKNSDIIITTPEKWDGISRNWQRRGYVQKVGLIIIDEIHLLGEDRGPVLEVIVSRMRYISSRTDRSIRFVGLSTALANARDLGDWLGIERVGLFNFKPAVRPVQMEAHIQGFPGKNYCPRMATMNKPTFAAIDTYSPEHPALVFVSSRRQTRLTGLELISLCAMAENPRRFLRMPEEEMSMLLEGVKDTSLRHTLAFGIGLHHAGLPESDRTLVEELFCNLKIQILICTSTLAWGVNFPARLVVIKGTEFFDAKLGRYVDFPITDVLQMMGRAGRPQFDQRGYAVIMVHEPKKSFYRKFLYEPFPVESQLKGQLPDHISAEIAGGTITSRHDAVEYLTWTYLFRRLLQNPAYYGLEDSSTKGVRTFLYGIVDEVFAELQESQCIFLGDDAVEALKADIEDGVVVAKVPDADDAVAATALGVINSFYYLHHLSTRLFADRLGPNDDFVSLLRLMCDASEFSELPVRHNEDELNEKLAAELPWTSGDMSFSSPHTKAFLLVQARLLHTPLPITDYINDTKSVMDQTLRVLNAMVDIAAECGYLFSTLALTHIVQCVVQARMPTDSTLLQLPHMSQATADALDKAFGDGETGPLCLPELLARSNPDIRRVLQRSVRMPEGHITDFLRVLRSLPLMQIGWELKEDTNGGEPGRVLGGTLAKEDGADVGAIKVGGSEPSGLGSSASTPIRVNANTDVVLTMRMTVKNSYAKKAHAPYYGRAKDWSCWFVVGDEEVPDGELLALKRAILDGAMQSTQELSFRIPATKGSRKLDMYLLTDAMRGMDQQYPLYLEVQ